MTSQNRLYTPAIIQNADTHEALVSYLFEELQRISTAFEDMRANLTLDTLHVAPAKPQEGLIVQADGTNWDPGSGAGFYGYDSGAWTFLG